MSHKTDYLRRLFPEGGGVRELGQRRLRADWYPRLPMAEEAAFVAECREAFMADPSLAAPKPYVYSETAMAAKIARHRGAALHDQMRDDAAEE